MWERIRTQATKGKRQCIPLWMRERKRTEERHCNRSIVKLATLYWKREKDEFKRRRKKEEKKGEETEILQSTTTLRYHWYATSIRRRWKRAINKPTEKEGREGGWERRERERNTHTHTHTHKHTHTHTHTAERAKDKPAQRWAVVSSITHRRAFCVYFTPSSNSSCILPLPQRTLSGVQQGAV